MCAFVVLGLVFPYPAKSLAWGTSPKWPVLCRVGRKTTTLCQSMSLVGCFSEAEWARFDADKNNCVQSSSREAVVVVAGTVCEWITSRQDLLSCRWCGIRHRCVTALRPLLQHHRRQTRYDSSTRQVLIGVSASLERQNWLSILALFQDSVV